MRQPLPCLILLLSVIAEGIYRFMQMKGWI